MVRRSETRIGALWAVVVSSTALIGLPAPATASPAADCLNPESEPRAGLEGCAWAERQLRLVGRDTKRGNPRANPSFPTELRNSKHPEADVRLARARHLARLGERDQARAALEGALAASTTADGVRSPVEGADEVRRLIESAGTRAEPSAPR